MSPDTGDRDVYRGRIIRCYFLVKLWMGFRLYVLNESLESEIRLSCDKDRNAHGYKLRHLKKLIVSTFGTEAVLQ